MTINRDEGWLAAPEIRQYACSACDGAILGNNGGALRCRCATWDWFRNSEGVMTLAGIGDPTAAASTMPADVAPTQLMLR